MSHFTVLVIGDNPEEQLAPFSERLEVAPYKRHEGWKDVWMLIKEYKTLNIASHFKDYYGEYGGVDLRGAYHWSTYNPASKWDWYQLGGRYSGRLILKNGKRADAARKGEIDFEQRRMEREQEGASIYDKVHAIVAGREIPSWEAIRAKHPGDIDAARKEYHTHPVIVDLGKDPDTEDIVLFGNIGEFRVSRDEYLRAARDSACVTFAVLKDGKWYERGEMGWWALVSNEKDRDQWNAEFNSLLDGLPDDAMLSIYDCHI